MLLIIPQILSHRQALRLTVRATCPGRLSVFFGVGTSPTPEKSSEAHPATPWLFVRFGFLDFSAKKGLTIGVPICYNIGTPIIKEVFTMANSASRATAAYMKRQGTTAKTYKLDAQLASDFRDACEEIERPQGEVLNQFMGAFIRAVEAGADTEGKALKCFFYTPKKRKKGTV
jgi:hypothetical protein